MICKRISVKLSKKIIIMHENAHPHTSDFTTVALATVDWEIMNHPSSSLETVDELKCSVLNWLHKSG
jgi:hypothetical protein